ncbi:MAG: hypothetical protein JNK82_20150 [Myxococcaceae bacterium]|nr:hypothetical protein [Myxococcaceae bacterium]
MWLSVVAALAGAEPSLSFTWEAPVECPPAESVRGRLGGGLTGVVRAKVEQRPQAFELFIDVDGSTRSLTTGTCEQAADAAVLIVRLALAGAAEPAPAAAAPPPAVTAPLEPQPVPLPVDLHVAALAVTEVLGLPRASFGFGGSAAARVGPVAFVLDVWSSLPQRYSGGPTADAQVELHAPFALRAGPCAWFGTGRLQGGPCVMGGAAWVTARGLNVTDPKVSTTVLGAAWPGARLLLRVASLVELQAVAAVRVGAAPTVRFGTAPAVVQGGWADLSLAVAAGVGW